MIVSICVAAVIFSFVRSGLTTWMPVILKESFLMKDEQAIFLTTFSNIVPILGIILSKQLVKKLKSHFLTISFLCLFIMVLFGISTWEMQYKFTVGFIIMTIINTMLINGVTSIITSQIPFNIKKYVNVGGVSSMFDAFCYVGNTISSYSVALVAEAFNWTVVMFIFLGIVTVGMFLMLFSYLFTKKDQFTQKCF